MSDPQHEVITREEWDSSYSEARQVKPTIIDATIYRKSFSSASNPALCKCSDGAEYVVKGMQVGRANFNDHVAGRLGIALGIPVGTVGLINVSQDFLDANRDALKHFSPGIAHGCRFIRDVSDDKEGINHIVEAANRDRFARLAVFYGWLKSNDPQFFYSKSVPRLVHSFDHGHFFEGGPNWSVTSLDRAGRAEVDSHILAAANLTDPEITLARSLFANVDLNGIASAMAHVPHEWGQVSDDERFALAKYLMKRFAVMRAQVGN